MRMPITDLDPRYSEPDAVPLQWSETERLISQAELWWVSTVGGDGRPHVTPLVAVWSDGVLHFATGEEEQKARNLEVNPRVVLTTGCATWGSGSDVVVHGTASRVTEPDRLEQLASMWRHRWDGVFDFQPGEGGFVHEHGAAIVFGVAPRTVFVFGKAEGSGQTRHRFPNDEGAP